MFSSRVISSLRSLPRTIALVLCAAPAHGDPQRAFALVPPLAYSSGDAWIMQGRPYRLYAVQSCIRGTPYVMRDGRQGDCGEASLRMLAAMIATLAVSCTPIDTARDGATIVVCAGRAHDKPVDLGAAMIVAGYAFAAERLDGTAVEAGYLASEVRAQSERAGLWGAKSFTHPVRALRQVGRAIPAPGETTPFPSAPLR